MFISVFDSSVLAVDVPVSAYHQHSPLSPTGLGYAPHPTTPMPPSLSLANPPPSPPGKRLAVVVGVSKYTRRRGGDLEWCDEDATAWYHYLTGIGFNCKVYGDEQGCFFAISFLSKYGNQGKALFFEFSPYPR